MNITLAIIIVNYLRKKKRKKKKKKDIEYIDVRRCTRACLVLDFIVLPVTVGIDGRIFASIGRIRILNNLCMEMHSLALIILTN